MSDDKIKTPHDSKPINLSEPYELRGWTTRLGVAEDEVQRAVATVGNSADMVRKHLRSFRK